MIQDNFTEKHSLEVFDLSIGSWSIRIKFRSDDWIQLDQAASADALASLSDMSFALTTIRLTCDVFERITHFGNGLNLISLSG